MWCGECRKKSCDVGCGVGCYFWVLLPTTTLMSSKKNIENSISKVQQFFLESRLYLLNIVHIVTKMQRLGKSIQTYWKNGLLKWNSSWDLVANSSEQNWMLVQTTMFFPIHVWENCTQHKTKLQFLRIGFNFFFVWSRIPDGESLPLFPETLQLHICMLIGQSKRSFMIFNLACNSKISELGKFVVFGG